ncbi:8884_t:CDS:2, partial [Entrophospora sp. SA101]
SSYCEIFDLTKIIPNSILESSSKLITLIDGTNWINQENIVKDNVDDENQYETILIKLQKIIKENNPRNILRIGIHSIASPFWKARNSNDVFRFLHALRGLIRNTYSSAIITIPAYLYEPINASFIRKIEHICDAVVEIESFAGFKLRRKRFSIEVFHLPPEGEIKETKSNNDNLGINEQKNFGEDCFQVSVNCQLNSDSPTYNFTVRKVGSCNLTLWENSPVLDQLDQLNVNITNVKRWMAYVKCDAPLMLKNITELDTSEAVILPYDYALCKYYLAHAEDLHVPIFVGTSESCNELMVNDGFYGTISPIITTAPTTIPPTVTDTTNDENKKVMDTYKTAMIILYAISGVVLGIFFLVIITNLVRNRSASSRPLARRSRDIDGNNDNNEPGITKSVLDSFPVYLFSLRGNNNDNNNDLEKNKSKAIDKLDTINDSTPVISRQADQNSEKFTKTDNDTNNDNKDVINIKIDTLQEPKAAILKENKSIVPPAILASNNITDAQLTCPICLGDFEQGEKLRILPCHHQYHISCIDPWLLDVSSLCPMCKADCTTWNIDESNNEDSKTPTTIITTTNSSTSSPIESRNNDHGAFPHFRWVKYLASIRKEGRRTSRLFRNSRGGSGIAIIVRVLDGIDGITFYVYTIVIIILVSL